MTVDLIFAVQYMVRLVDLDHRDAKYHRHVATDPSHRQLILLYRAFINQLKFNF